MDLYQFYSYESPGIRTDPTLGATIWNIQTEKTNFRILLLWNWKGESFDFWYVASLYGPLSVLFIRWPLSQNWSHHEGSQVGTIGTKKVEFILGGKWLSWVIQGHHCPLVFNLQMMNLSIHVKHKSVFYRVESWKKKKMLDTSIFSFSHNVFKGLFLRGMKSCHCLVNVNSLPHNPNF